MANLAVAIEIAAKDLASKSIKGVEGALGDLGKSSVAAQEVLKPVAIATAGMTAAMGLAAKTSMDFNAGMANVATLIPGSTARVKELSGAVQSMAITVGKSTDDLTGGLYQVVSAFGDTADTTRILEINAKAAAAGLATTTDAINLTSAVTKGYGDSSAEAVQKVSDLAFQTVKMGQTTFPELASSMGKVVPIAAALGVTQEELFAQMATLTGVTGGAAEVSTQLRAVFQSLLKPTAEMGKAIRDVAWELDQQGRLAGGPLVDNWKRLSEQHLNAVDTYHRLRTQMEAMDAAGQSNTKEFRTLAAQVKDAKAELKPMSDAVDAAAAALGQTLVQSVGTTEALSLLSDAAGGNSQQLGKMFGSVEALGAVLALSGGQADTFAEKSAAMADVTGMSAEAFDEQTNGANNAGFALAQLQVKTSVLTQRFGQELLPIVGAAASAVMRLMDAFLNLSPTAVKFVAIAAAVTTGLTVLTTAGLGLLAILPTMVAGWAALSLIMTGTVVPAMTAVWTALMGPLGLALLAITAAVGVMALAWSNNWGDIQGKTEAAWTFLNTEVFQPIGAALAWLGDTILPDLRASWEGELQKIERIWTWLSGTILQPGLAFLGRVWTIAWTSMGTSLRETWESMRLAVGVAWDLLQGFITTGLALLKGDWGGAWDAIFATVVNIWQRINETTNGALQDSLERLVSWGHEAWDVMREAGRLMVEGIKNGLAGMWDAIVSPVQEAIKAAQDALSNFRPNVGGIIQSAGAAASSAISSAFDWGAYNFARNMGATEEEANLRATGRGAGAPILGGDAAQSGEGAISWAMQNVGAPAWNWLCQKFVENAFGTAGRYPSAKAAADALQTNRGGTPARGSLVFFKPDPTNANFGHVGIALGGNQFVSATANGVKVDSLTDSYWGRLYTGFGLPRFATGGSFLVPGAGGTDSQLVQFMATPKERVTVETPGQYSNRSIDAQTIARAVADALSGMRVSLDRQGGEDFVVFHTEGARRRGRL